MFIESIQIEDLRCFRQAAVSFRHPELASPGSAALPNVTLLLGNNGAGKAVEHGDRFVGVHPRKVQAPRAGWRRSKGADGGAG